MGTGSFLQPISFVWKIADTVGLTQDIRLVESDPMMQDRDASWTQVVMQVKAEYAEVLKKIAAWDCNDMDAHFALGNDPTDFRNLQYGNDNLHVGAYHGTMARRNGGGMYGSPVGATG